MQMRVFMENCKVTQLMRRRQSCGSLNAETADAPGKFYKPTGSPHHQIRCDVITWRFERHHCHPGATAKPSRQSSDVYAAISNSS